MLRLLFILILFFSLTFEAHGASDGTEGATSTGSFDVSVEIPPRVRISGVADIAFGTWSGTGNLSQSDDVCIYSSEASGLYAVTVTGSGPSGSFELSDGGSGTIPFSVAWNDQTGTTGNSAVSATTPLTSQSGACDKSTSCSSGCGSNNANFEVTIDQSDLASATTGSYSATISILIEAE